MTPFSTDVILVNIMQFLDVGGASNSRSVDHQFKRVLDSNEYWNGFLYQSKKPSILLLKHTSVGLGGIISRQSIDKNMCVSCGECSDSYRDNSYSHIQTHPFFGIMACKFCMKTDPVLSIISENKACKKYKITTDDMYSIARVKKRTYHVLDCNARECGELKHGVSFIQSMLDKSKKRRLCISMSRLEARSKRISQVKTGLKSKILLDLGYIRADSIFLDFHICMDVINYHNMGNYLLGDIFEKRVSVKRSVPMAVCDIYDFCCLLTFCKRMNILLDDYKECSPGHIDFAPGIVLKNSYNGGSNFYDFICKYTKSVEALMARSRSVELYTKHDGTRVTKKDRTLIVDILCIEDFVEINYEPFEEYIEYGEGDPVFIVRELRKMDVFFQHGLYEEIEYLNSIGMSEDIVYSTARSFVIREMGGLPIMNRFFIDDRIPSL